MTTCELAPPESESAANFDRLIRSQIGKFSYNLSPPGLLLVYLDWCLHYLFSPGKQHQLAVKSLRKLIRFYLYAVRSAIDPSTPPAIEPLPQDHRFDDPSWHSWPFNLYYQSFLCWQQWWANATTGIRGVSRHDEEVVSFAARQLLDIISPANFVWSNPEVLQATLQQGGMNLAARLAQRPRRPRTPARRSPARRRGGVPGRQETSPSPPARSSIETASSSSSSTAPPPAPSPPSPSSSSPPGS